MANDYDDTQRQAKERAAFDLGRADALASKPESPPTDMEWDLQEDYCVGYSSGFLDLPKSEQDRLNNA